MKSYNSTLTGLKSKSLFTATLLLSVALNFIGIIQLSAQEHVDIDTLLYCYHNPEQDQYPDMLPEDCYMELYLENGTLKKGYFWGTTDEFEQVREGYECGYFVMPMTNIRQGKDSISFCLNIVKTSSGEKVNTFVKAPIDLHIRSWQEAMSRYQTWEPFTDRMEDEIQMSISFARWLENDVVRYDMSPTKDTIIVKNLTCPYSSGHGRVFVLLKDKARQ